MEIVILLWCIFGFVFFVYTLNEIDNVKSWSLAQAIYCYILFGPLVWFIMLVILVVYFIFQFFTGIFKLLK